MAHNVQKPDSLTRRAALKRLGLAVGAAYIVPEVLMLSKAHAQSAPSHVSDPSEPSGGTSSGPSGTTVTATPPTPPTAPSNIETLEADETDHDYCKVSAPSGEMQISRADMERAQAAVDAGYAKSLSAIWPDLMTTYNGNIIGIEFTGFRWRPRYRLRAISARGHLETVIVSARTGEIIRIVGC